MESLGSQFDPKPAALMPGVPAAPETFRFAFHGEGGAFFFVLLKNLLLTLVTLGIYLPWAKTHRRQYIWSNVEIHGQRLSYTGTGRELFLGYLKLLGVYALFIGAIVVGEMVHKGLGAILQVALLIPILILVPFAIYWSQAFLFSRTNWRGLRFGLRPGAKPYALIFIGGYLLSLITLGIYSPFWFNDLRRELTNNTRFGNEPFHYDGVGKEVFWIMLKGVLLSIITLGIYSFWMSAELQRYYFAHTRFAGARGRFQVTGGTLFGLFLLNVLGTTLTLGLAFPWITVHTLRTILGGITFEGSVDFARIEQGIAPAGAEGDVLADAFDVGIGI